MLNNMMSLSFGQGGLHQSGNTQIKEIFITNLDWQTNPTGFKHSCLFQIENKAFKNWTRIINWKYILRICSILVKSDPLKFYSYNSFSIMQLLNLEDSCLYPL